jgi:hypothetical protein
MHVSPAQTICESLGPCNLYSNTLESLGFSQRSKDTQTRRGRDLTVATIGCSNVSRDTEKAGTNEYKRFSHGHGAVRVILEMCRARLLALACWKERDVGRKENRVLDVSGLGRSAPLSSDSLFHLNCFVTSTCSVQRKLYRNYLRSMLLVHSTLFTFEKLKNVPRPWQKVTDTITWRLSSLSSSTLKSNIQPIELSADV